MNDVCALVLAAGDGKRMKSKYPKVLCRVLEQPMIQWVLRSVRDAGIEKICVITGKNGELTRYDKMVVKAKDIANRKVVS